MKKMFFVTVFLFQNATTMNQPLLSNSTMIFSPSEPLSVVGTYEDINMRDIILKSKRENLEILSYCCRVIQRFAPTGSGFERIFCNDVQEYRKIFRIIIEAEHVYNYTTYVYGGTFDKLANLVLRTPESESAVSEEDDLEDINNPKIDVNRAEICEKLEKAHILSKIIKQNIIDFSIANLLLYLSRKY